MSEATNQPDPDMDSCDKHRIHEAGHAFIMRYLGVELKTVYSNCIDNGHGKVDKSGETIPADIDDLRINHPADMCKIAVAGYVSERIASGRGMLSQEDLGMASSAARRVLIASGTQPEQVDKEENELIEEMIQEVKQILQYPQNWKCVRAIAERLKIGPIHGNNEVDEIISATQ